MGKTKVDPASVQADTDDGDDGATDDKAAATGTDWQAEAAKWKALARKHETTAKQNAGAAQKLADLEDADKTELQKAIDRTTLLEKELADERAARLRAEIAAEMGLSKTQAKRLVGSTEEELRADAAELLESFGGGKKADDKPAGGDKPDTGGQGAGSRRPRETLRPGAAPADTAEKVDYDAMAARIMGRRI